MNLCIECREKPIHIKKRKLCSHCYQKLYRNLEEGNRLFDSNKALAPKTIKHVRVKREMDFVRNYFNHKDWLYEPAIFNLGEHGKYTPDFYDKKTNTFIEVVGSRQAYHSNKDKYIEMREIFSGINFEVRTCDGELVDESGRIEWPAITNSPAYNNNL